MAAERGLSPSEAAEAMNAASRNAKRLASDARLLLQAESWPSAAALSILAIEEAGKLAVYRELAVVTDPAALRDCWKRLRSHRAKNAMWPFFNLVIEGASCLNDFRSLFDEESSHTRDLDIYKQRAIYTDFAPEQCSEPVDVVGQSDAAWLVQTAEVFAHATGVTDREMELWVEHMKPAWSTHQEVREHALVKWHRAMQDEGLAESGDGMERFVCPESGDLPPDDGGDV